VPITADDLKTPKGEFKISMFPDDEGDEVRFDARLDAYVDAGIDKATAAGIADPSASFDRAVKAWATYLGANEIYNDMLTTPASVDVKDKTQASFTATQFNLWAEKLAKYLAAFEDEVGLVSTTIEQKFSPTGNVPHRIAFGNR